MFAVGAADETGILRAVAIVGRPVARHLDDGTTLEVTRTASDGTRNANSLLYGASWRAAKALGYRRLITFTQEGESGPPCAARAGT
ncbi:XF1762 family protein [Streptomyces sp. NPDC058440]|uniref:XF1762 family protein n=1 Tax=Streptomyces sp. NPDC058440 TaxID=3346501 RepID=UPI0036571FB6